MKTFFGTFKEGGKQYPFNTEGEVKEGDILKLDDYTTPVTVTDILTESFKFFTYKGNGLSNDLTLPGTGLIKVVTFEKVEKE